MNPYPMYAEPTYLHDVGQPIAGYGQANWIASNQGQLVLGWGFLAAGALVGLNALRGRKTPRWVALLAAGGLIVDGAARLQFAT